MDSVGVTVSFAEALKHIRSQKNSRLQEQIREGVITPIELAKIVGCKPQMIYNYIRNNRIAASKTLDTQKLVVDMDDAVQFVADRLTKNAQRAAKVQAELQAL